MENDKVKLFDVGDNVWVDRGNGKGAEGVISKVNVLSMESITYEINFPSGMDSRGSYNGHTDWVVRSEDVYRYSPLERLARIERALGIED